MSWQRRGGKRLYLYHTIRIGDRFMNIYLGNGKTARSFEVIRKHVNALKRYARDLERQARDGVAAGRVTDGLSSTAPTAPTNRPIGPSPPPDLPL